MKYQQKNSALYKKKKNYRQIKVTKLKRKCLVDGLNMSLILSSAMVKIDQRELNLLMKKKIKRIVKFKKKSL